MTGRKRKAPEKNERKDVWVQVPKLFSGDSIRSKSIQLPFYVDSSSTMRKGKVHVGTSGYNYPNWRKGLFYPVGLSQKKEFDFYASVFSTVEINNTFYVLPKDSVWRNWEKRAPLNFIYSVKVSRYLTEMKKLKDPEDSWKRFWNGCQMLKEHLGPILFQLPPSFVYNDVNLQRVIHMKYVLPSNHPIAWEFRHLSWFQEQVYKILRENNWSLVLLPPCPAFDLPPVLEELTSNNFVYVRWHGSIDAYVGSYSADYLVEWATKINAWRMQGIDVFVYFNNTDEQASAVSNAQQLLTYLQKEEAK